MEKLPIYIYWSSQTTIQIHLWPGNLFRKVKKVSGFSSGNKKNHVFTRDLLAAFPKKKIFFSMTLRRTEGNELTCMSRDKNVESDKTMSRLSGKRFEFHSLYKEVPQGKVHKKSKNKCDI